MTAAVIPRRRHQHSSSLFSSSNTSHLPRFSSRKPQISPPYSGRHAYSLVRSSSSQQSPIGSLDSISSISSNQPEPVPAHYLQNTAIALMDNLINTPNLNHVSALLSPNVHFHHDCAINPATVNSRDEFLSFWEELQTTHLAGTWECKIMEASADEEQRKVWVVGQMRRLDGGNRVDAGFVETVEMLTFNERGMVCDIQDYQRRVRIGNRDED